MGCQKDIAAKIVDRGGDYVLALKENHPKLYEAVEQQFSTALASTVPPRGLRRQVTAETSHGREERREYFAMTAPASLPGFTDWKSLVSACDISGRLKRLQKSGSNLELCRKMFKRSDAGGSECLLLFDQPAKTITKGSVEDAEIAARIQYELVYFSEDLHWYYDRFAQSNDECLARLNTRLANVITKE